MWNKKKILKNLVKKKAEFVRQLNSKWEEDAIYSRTVSTFVYQKWIEFEKMFVPLRRYAIDLSVLLLVAVIGTYILFPTVANADMEHERVFDRDTIERIIAAMQNETAAYGHLPVSAEAAPRKTYSIPLTAYNSEPGQTDDTPCITASGLDVCERNIENVVAANFLPLGTRVRIPELYGDRVFYVEDRMNKRYHYKMDIWMKDKSTAIAFGVQYATVEVF